MYRYILRNLCNQGKLGKFVNFVNNARSHFSSHFFSPLRREKKEREREDKYDKKEEARMINI